MRYLYLFLFFALQFSIASAQLQPSTQVRFIRQDCGLQVFSEGKTQMILDLTSIQWSVTTKANQTHVTIFDGVSEISVRSSDIDGYSPKNQSAKLLVEDLTEWKALCNSIFYLDSMVSVLNAILEDSTVCVTCPVELGDETMTSFGKWFITTWKVIESEFGNQNTLLGDLFNETWNVISKEFDNQNSLLKGWFSDLGATIQACCKDIIETLKVEFKAQNELLQTEFDQTQLELDSIQIVINEEFVKQNSLLNKLFDKTWSVISQEFDNQNTLLDGWFTNLTNAVTDCCKAIITKLEKEFAIQNELLQTEFDESQLELDTIAAAISDQTDTVVLTIENLYSLIDGISFDTTQVDTNDLTPVITELKDLYTLISGINFDTTHVDTNDLSPLLAELDSIAMAISDQSDTLITTMTALLTDSLLSSGCAYTADFDKLSGPGTITYPANSLHSLDFVVVAGSVSVTIGAKTLVFGVGETASFNSGECKNLLNNFVFTTTGVSDVVNIQLLK